MTLNDFEVLVVDDSAAMRRLLIAALNAMGARRIVEAECAQDCLDVLNAFSPSLIIVDLDLPDMLGVDLIQKIRKETRHGARIPIAIVSAHAADLDDVANRAGADVAISKPITMRSLADGLAVAISARAA